VIKQRRCAWAGSDPLYLRYHDREWGVPQRRDRRLFEMLILEGAQAGLSWSTILRKRQGYRRAFAGFDPQKFARFNRRKIESLLRDEGIVRNRRRFRRRSPTHALFWRSRRNGTGFTVSCGNSSAVSRS
jgi:DNA-3-methyladenine glycosylase I